MNWHYAEQGQQIGPVSDEQFAELIRAGKINDETLVWREGMSNWLPYGQTKPEFQTSGGIATGKTSEAVCNECGRIFPIDEMIRHGDVRVCADCKPVFLQKLSEGAQIQTGALNYAGIGSRFVALLLDGVILGAVNVGISLIMGMTVAQSVGVKPRVATGFPVGFLAIQLGIAIFYEVFFVGKYGATWGKMICQIKIVTADGGRVSYARALGRYFSRLLSAFTCLIGYIIAFFDSPQRRALHDYICNTRVVRK